MYDKMNIITWGMVGLFMTLILTEQVTLFGIIMFGVFMVLHGMCVDKVYVKLDSALIVVYGTWIEVHVLLFKCVDPVGVLDNDFDFVINVIFTLLIGIAVVISTLITAQRKYSTVRDELSKFTLNAKPKCTMLMFVCIVILMQCILIGIIAYGKGVHLKMLYIGVVAVCLSILGLLYIITIQIFKDWRKRLLKKLEADDSNEE